MIEIDSLVKENENREGRQEGRSAAGARPALAPGRWGGAGGGRGARAARGVRVSRPSCANRGVSALRVPACPSHPQPRDCGASPLPWAGASWSRSREAARRDGPGVQAPLPDRRGRRSPRSGASLAGGGGSLGPARAVTTLPLAVPTGSAISCPELRKAWPGSP